VPDTVRLMTRRSSTAIDRSELEAPAAWRVEGGTVQLCEPIEPMQIVPPPEPMEAVQPTVPGPSVVGESPAMRELLQTVAQVGPKDITVLIRGETGTGKELIASRVHAESTRASAPLVRFNCAAIPAELAEAELFGHARGAFTGANSARVGFFSAADGGTLILDEVGELPLPIQAKLLRVLQGGEIQQVGTSRIDRVDVRVIACTNRDLAAEARRGRFRMDLYYRLAVVELIVPPLREHREDIPRLAVQFAERYARRFGNDDVRLSPALIEALCERDWPGNVRELENTIARVVALSGGGEIDVELLQCTRPGTVDASPEKPGSRNKLSLRDQLAAYERRIIGRTLVATAGNRSRAARLLGLSRTALFDRLKKYDLATGLDEAVA
jgi:transcriptional regulator with GAF, ATPase, and Fis domain